MVDKVWADLPVRPDLPQQAALAAKHRHIWWRCCCARYSDCLPVRNLPVCYFALLPAAALVVFQVAEFAVRDAK